MLVLLVLFPFQLQSDSEESESELEVESICGPAVTDVEVAQQIKTKTDDLRAVLTSRYWAGEPELQLLKETGLAHDWYDSTNTAVIAWHFCYCYNYYCTRETIVAINK